MKALLVIGILILIGLVIWWCRDSKSPFTAKDHSQGKEAVRELFTMLDKGKEPPEISDEELAKLSDDIFLVVTPSKNSKEHLSFFHPVNTRYWPYYYYSFPYNYKYGGAWPPGMYSRLYFWSPGFYTGTGWMYYMRPGMGYKYWQRNIWLRNNGNYYNVSNKSDYTHDAADYANTPLSF